jgi:hypothetical protein
MDVPSGKPLSERQIDVSSGVTGQREPWMAGPPEPPGAVEPGAGELAPPGEATRQGRVDIPARPGSDR